MRKLHMPYLQITEAALNLYAAEGPKGVTMRRVAAALGVRASALYRHYKNKDALLDSVAGAAELRLARCLERPNRPRVRGNVAEALTERALQFSVEHSHLFQLVSRRRYHRDAPPSAGPRAAAIRAEVASAIERGHLRRDDPDVAGTALWAHLCGLVALRERGDLPLGGKPLREAWCRSTRRLFNGLQSVYR